MKRRRLLQPPQGLALWTESHSALRRIRAALEKWGRPIGVNDLHIAAHARSEGLVLVMNNTSEFDPVPALELENWVGTSP